MFRKIIGIMVVLLPVLSPVPGAAYSWPVKPFDSQHPIFATIGEYRTPTRVHAGVDIGEGAGAQVYSVTDGTVINVNSNINGSVRIRTDSGTEYEYVHITPSIVINSTVTVGVTVLGEIADIDAPHLHFTENKGGSNPLRDGGLTPYVDKSSPTIVSVDFWKQGTEEQLTGSLYGHIDLRVNTFDPRTSVTGDSAGGNCGIYKITIEFWQGGNLIGDKIEYHIYNKIPPSPVSLVYATGSTQSIFLYWATNDPFNVPYDKYWNSNQRTGSDYTVNALIPSQALYPEGSMLIRVIAEDIRGNKAIHDIGQQ